VRYLRPRPVAFFRWQAHSNVKIDRAVYIASDRVLQHARAQESLIWQASSTFIPTRKNPASLLVGCVERFAYNLLSSFLCTSKAVVKLMITLHSKYLSTYSPIHQFSVSGSPRSMSVSLVKWVQPPKYSAGREAGSGTRGGL
jgi:hypothetical protein